MLSRASEKQSFHFECFVCNNNSLNAVDRVPLDVEGHLGISREIRKAVLEIRKKYVIGYDINTDLQSDQVCRHLIGFLGDLPFMTARWKISKNQENGLLYAELDRFAVLAPYRRRGFGRTCLVHILGDIQSTSRTQQGVISSVQMVVPAFCIWIGSKLESFGFVGISMASGDVLYSRGI